MEAETTRVAELRREAPQKAAAAYVAQLRKEMEAEEERRMQILEAVVKKGTEEGNQGLKGVGVERGGEIEERWKDAKGGLEALRGVTEVLARLERAGKAVEVVERM